LYRKQIFNVGDGTYSCRFAPELQLDPQFDGHHVGIEIHFAYKPPKEWHANHFKEEICRLKLELSFVFDK